MTAEASPPTDDTERVPPRVPRWIVFWSLFIAAIALDWWSKSAAAQYHLRTNGLLAESRPTDVFEFGVFNFQFVREFNGGMAFGLLQEIPNAHWYLGAIRAAAVVVSLCVLLRPALRSGWYMLGFGALAAGAAGNLLDNLFNTEFGHEHSVQDFILLSFANRSLPAFNLADLYVTIGALTFFVMLARSRRRH